MLGLHEHSLSYGQVAVERGTASLSIMSQRENGFRVNSRAKGLTNAARQAIRIQSLQGGQPGSINGVGSHEIGSGFNFRRRSQPGSIPGRGPAGFNCLGKRSHDSKAIHYFIPSLVALGRGIYISLMIRFLYYNCLGLI